MHILLIGATGMVGNRILTEALDRGHHVTAASRNPDRIHPHQNVTAIALNGEDPDAITEASKGVDVVISAISPRNTGDALRDAEAFTNALITALRRTGKRLLMVGGGSSLVMPDGTSALAQTPEAILPEAAAMRRAYAMLVTADIDFVVLAPGGMIAPGERTTSFRLSGRTMITEADGGKSNISAEDYAIAMLDEMEEPKHYRTIFNVAY